MAISNDVWMLFAYCVGVMIGYALKTIKQMWLDWEGRLENKKLLRER